MGGEDINSEDALSVSYDDIVKQAQTGATCVGFGSFNNKILIEERTLCCVETRPKRDLQLSVW